MAKKPNILVLMVDQLAPQTLGCYGHKVVHSPNIDKLANNGLVFDSAYCNSPLCTPSRASFISGQLCPEIGAYDNGAEFPSSVPTIAHFMRSVGYDTTLCGKMHFVGSDQLHGFQERLTTDIYPANFTWTPNWGLPVTSPNPAGATVRPILEAGPCIRNMQMDYDEEVAFKARQKIYDLARRQDDANPFFLLTSFTHPHPPFTCAQKYWDLYDGAEIDLPKIGRIPPEELDVASQYLFFGHRRHRYKIKKEHILATRRAYYGMISYIDELIGGVLDTLSETGLADDTIIIFISDHGEMLGERGMWYKMSMYEWSVRVPMIITGKGVKTGRISHNVSLADLAPTLIDLGGGSRENISAQLCGNSLRDFMRSGKDSSWADTVISDYSAGAAPGPIRMVKKGNLKLVDVFGHDPLLFDLKEDPDELNNIANRSDMKEYLKELIEIARQNHSPENYKAKIEQSQKDRIFIREVGFNEEKEPNWSFVSNPGDDSRFVRGGGLFKGAHATKSKAQLPKVKEASESIDETVDVKMINEISQT